MKFSFSLLAGLAVASARIVTRQQGSLPAVETRGNAFYTGDDRFYIRGVAYQPGGAADAQDPLLDISNLRRDIERFKELGINTIRVYTIDNSKDHDEAMRMLDDAGIYLALDVNTPKVSLNRESRASLHASYNDVYLQSVFATIEGFGGYSNLLLFFAANEVINARNNTHAAPYIKAVTRDMKQFIAANSPRPIPVGYSAADVAENIEPQALYFACGDDAFARADFFAFNDYSWCDPSSFTESGWNRKVETYSDYSLPLFLSEFGCITNTREWNEIAALYSTNMTGVYSGGLAYEYTLEENGYGLVEEGSNGDIRPNDDFRRLRQAYEKTPSPRGDGGARTNTTPPRCPPESEEWAVTTDRIPTIPKGAEKYIKEGAGSGPGLGGESSQWAGTPTETKVDLSDGVTKSDNVADGVSNNNNNGGNNGGSSGGSSGGSNSEGAAAGLSLSWQSAVVVGVSLAYYLS